MVLKKELFLLNTVESNPENAIRLAGDLLEEQGYVDASYTDDLLLHYTKDITHFSFSHLIAVAHVSQSDKVNKTGVSVVRLNHSIPFGYHNNPVRLIFCISAESEDKEVAIFEEISEYINHPTVFSALLNEDNADNILEVISAAKRWKEIK